MYAVVKIGGHQYKVSENDTLFVDRQNVEGDTVTFEDEKYTLVRESEIAMVSN